jgi:hypothetical protein
MAALSLAGKAASAAEMIALAEQLAPWIRRGGLVLSVSSRMFEQGSSRSVPTEITHEGDRIVATMKDNFQFTASVKPEDAKGFADPDTLTWSADDAGAVVTLQPSDDSLSCLIVAVAPGVANYTFTDGVVSGSGVATVVPGDVASLALSESDPVEQPPAPPSA